MKDKDNFSKHVRRILNCLETVSGKNSLIVTPEALEAGKEIVESIPDLTGNQRFFIMTAAVQLAESDLNEEIDINLSNKCRGSVVRNYITQHVVDSAVGVC